MKKTIILGAILALSVSSSVHIAKAQSTFECPSDWNCFPKTITACPIGYVCIRYSDNFRIETDSSKTITTTSQNTNTSVAPTNTSAITNKLAELNQIDFHIDNDPMVFDAYQPASILTGTSSLLNVLNTSKRIDGSSLFVSPRGNWYISYPSFIPNSYNLHKTVSDYRQVLKDELVSSGSVTVQL